MIGINKQNTRDMGKGKGVSEIQATWGREYLKHKQHGDLKLSTTKEGAQKISGSNNINRFPGPTL